MNIIINEKLSNIFLVQLELPDVKTIVSYVQRYFIHRTGVKPNDYLAVYLQEELNKAKGN